MGALEFQLNVQLILTTFGGGKVGLNAASQLAPQLGDEGKNKVEDEVICSLTRASGVRQPPPQITYTS